MNISVIGTGYVGLVCGAGFSEMGNRVICVDSDEKKINSLCKGVIPIYEPGLEEIVRDNSASGNLKFTIDIQAAIASTNICFIAVGTPMTEDGSADTKHVLSVARAIGKYMNKHMYVVGKSTVPIGTSDKIRACIDEELKQRGSDLTFDVTANPEFLKEGMAVADFMKPDRVVVGVDNERSLKIMNELYAPFTKNRDSIIVMDIRSAEMTKYAANAMLATKISFMNEISNICECVGADVNKVRTGIGSDSRIGYHFLYPGCGYGGSCFPKDVQALVQTSLKCGYEPQLLSAVDKVNEKQKCVLINKIHKRFGANLNGRTFAVWGLAFKPGTDDMREAPSISIVNHLVNSGAQIKAYDPKAIEKAKNIYFKKHVTIEYFLSKYDAIKSVDAMLLLTEWKEFRSPDFEEMLKLMSQPIIFDGRNQYDIGRMTEMGFEYHQIGVRNSSLLPVNAFFQEANGVKVQEKRCI